MQLRRYRHVPLSTYDRVHGLRFRATLYRETPVNYALSIKHRILSVLLVTLGIVGLCSYSTLAAAPPTGQSDSAPIPLSVDTWSNFATFAGPIVDTIFCLHTTADGYLWAGTTDGVSVRSPTGGWQSMTMDDGLAGNRIAAIVTEPTNPQRHWFATNGGASLLDDGGTPLDKHDDQWMTFGKRDGLLDHRVSSVTIAPNGDLWFGLAYLDTAAGVRFGNGISVLQTNGTPFDKSDDQWRSFTTANSALSTNVIHKLVTDAAGIIWIATPNGLYAYQNGQWQSFSMEQGLPANEISAVLVVGQQLWVGTANGFGLLDHGGTLSDRSDDRWMTYTNTTLAVPSISSLVLDSQGYLWVGSYTVPSDYQFDDAYAVGSALLIDLKQTPFSMADDQWMAIDSWQIVAPRALAVQDGMLWAATRYGLRHVNYTSFPFAQSQWQWQDADGGKGIDGNRITAIAPFGDDRLALAVDGYPRVLFHANTPHTLRDDTVANVTGYTAGTLAADSQQRLWLGSGDTIFLLDPGARLDDEADDKVHEYSATTGVPLHQINKIVLDAADRVWVADGDYLHGSVTVLSPGQKVADITDDQTAAFTTQNSGLPGHDVTTVALGQANDLWIGTNAGAAHLVYGASPFAEQDDQWTTFTPQTSGIADSYIRDVAVDSAGNAWFALATGGVSVYTTDGTWVTFTEADGLLFNAVTAVAVDQRGRIWLGTDGEGMSVLDYGSTIADKRDDQWQAYRPGAPLLTGYIQTLLVDSADFVWIGTDGGGLSLYSVTALTPTYLPLIYHQPSQPLPAAGASALPVGVTPATEEN